MAAPVCTFLVTAAFRAATPRSLVFAAFRPAALSFGIQAAFFPAERRLLGTRPEQNLRRSHGLESQKISGHSRGIFLDFPFYRTYRDLARFIWMLHLRTKLK